ncbi:PPOX class F420-dependent oxidoreductase [soil metagenome]
MSEVIPSTHLDLLATTALAHVATIGPKGEPQSSPVWFGWDGTYVRIVQQVGLQQKVRNLQREPRVALSIVDPANAYRCLEIRGTVERIEPDVDREFINSMAKKYLDEDRYSSGKPEDEFLVIVIRPERTTQMG